MSDKMKIMQFRILSGPNYWSLQPCMQMLLDIGELEEQPTNKLRDFTNALQRLFHPFMNTAAVWVKAVDFSSG